MDPSPLPEPRVAEMIAGVKDYMRKEQALYLPASDPLSAEWRSALQHYFPESLLSTVKTVTLEGARIPPPPFYADAIALSSGHFPDFILWRGNGPILPHLQGGPRTSVGRQSGAWGVSEGGLSNLFKTGYFEDCAASMHRRRNSS
jgi:hypothetical protein